MNCLLNVSLNFKNMRQKYIPLILLLLLGMASGAQDLSPKVIPAQGGNYVAGTVDLSWTLGETSIPTLSAGSNMLSEGFEQPEVEILTGTIATTACSSSPISVPFTATGIFGPANVFTAQLSDAAGSFASPTNIGTVTGNFTSGTISATIPGAASGAHYRIRVVSSIPVYNGVQNNSDIAISSCVTTSYTWTGATSTSWAVTTNWSPVAPVGGPNACSADVIIPLVPNQPVVSSAVNVGSLQLNSGATLTLNADLGVCKNFTGGASGVYSNVVGTGILVLNGTSAQTLTGYSKINELKLNNSTGAALSSTATFEIMTALDLQSGNFNATVGTLTFRSTSVTQCAIIDNFSAGFSGTFNGTVHAQRYYLASLSYNQHFMGTPVDATAFSQFGASGTAGYIVPTTSCDETQIAPGSPYSTILALDETHGATCTSAQWIAEAASSGNMTDGRGYAVAKPGAGVFTVTGNPNLNATYALSGLTNSNWTNSTLQGHTVTSGWHLIANPYLASLSPGSLTAAGFDNQIQVWNANGPFAGSYQPYVAGVNAVIPPFGAFMVHKTNPGGTATFTLKATDRVRTAATFYQANSNELNIVAENNSNNLLDQTLVAFNASATDQFDADVDANKSPGALNRHTLYSINNGQWMSRNVLHDIEHTSTVPVGFEAGSTGSYTLHFNGLSTFAPTSYIYLEDKALGVMYNVRNGDYTFTADSGDAWDRFVLHFTPAAVFSTTDASCNAHGNISVTQPGVANWNYTLVDANSTTVSTGVLNQSNPFTASVPVGTYTLTLVDNNNYTVTQVLNVNGPQAAVAAFNASSNAVLENQDVVFTSTSTGVISYAWDFGNGQTATGQNVTYQYTTPGTYTVVLTVGNASGCVASTAQTITVNDVATNLNNITDNKHVAIWSSENNVFVDFNQLSKVDAVINIYNILGQEMVSEKFTTNTLYRKEIKNIDAAYMIVSVKVGDKLTNKKVFIHNFSK